MSDNLFRELTHPPRTYYRTRLFTLNLEAVMADTVQASKSEEEEQEEGSGDDDENDEDDDNFGEEAEM